MSAGPDIDFIDTNQDHELDIRKSSITTKPKQFSRFRSDQNANKPFTRSRKGSKSHEHQDVVGTDVKNERATINVIVSLVSTTTTVNSMDTTKSKIEKSLKLSGGDLNRNSGQDTENVTLLCNSKENLPNRISNDICPKDVEQSKESSVANSMETPDIIAGVSNWKQENDHAYGMAVSLYEKNFLTQEQAGSPIADCFGLVVRGNSAAMALADGVNWGNFVYVSKIQRHKPGISDR